MSSADSRSDSDLDVKELALRIALERSKVDTGQLRICRFASPPSMQRGHRSWPLPAHP